MPAAAMYHELLHSDLKNSGYRQFTIGLVTNEQSLKLIELLSPIDNELQHHKMYKSFLAAGFRPERFYADIDRNSYRDLCHEVSSLYHSYGLSSYFLKFLTVIAPGGCGKAAKRQDARELIFSKCGANYQRILEEVEQDIKEWALSPDNDQSGVLFSILTKLGFSGAWVGRSKNFPTDGFL
ncbi:hypothetical protein [Methylorubrum thiocyanatum]|uniref:hypothetical protein n=1 Tax=Methylorubrum thiocyanatum TaxID=47958 RepID=UPI0036569950